MNCTDHYFLRGRANQVGEAQWEDKRHRPVSLRTLNEKVSVEGQNPKGTGGLPQLKSRRQQKIKRLMKERKSEETVAESYRSGGKRT